MTESENNGWNEHKMFVINKLEEQSITQREILHAVNDLKTDMAVEKNNMKWLTVKISAIISAIIGGILQWIGK